MPLLLRQAPRRLVLSAIAPPPRVQRDWYPTRQAAALIGISERTLRRRVSQPAWKDGFHYRWVSRAKRLTLEVNVTRAIKLMDQRGWV